MEIVVAIIAGLFSICVAIFGAVFINLNNVKLQTRKLKEDHYVMCCRAYENVSKSYKIKNGIPFYVNYIERDFFKVSPLI